MEDESRDELCEYLEVCGCVDDEVLNWLVAELRACAESKYDSSIESQKARVYLDSKGWIEHGVAIRGSWLTEKGKRILAAVDALEKAK